MNNNKDSAIIKAISNGSEFSIKTVRSVYEQTKSEKTTRSVLQWAQRLAIIPMMMLTRPKKYGLELINEEYVTITQGGL